jgi:hypothetical protein
MSRAGVRSSGDGRGGSRERGLGREGGRRDRTLLDVTLSAWWTARRVERRLLLLFLWLGLSHESRHQRGLR